MDNNEQNKRNNRENNRRHGIMHGGKRIMIPEDTHKFSIKEAHRNVINLFANYREEEIMIRNNFENGNELVNYFNFTGGRNNANIPHETERDSSLNDISIQNFPLVFNDTVKNIYSQLNNLTVNFDKFKDMMEKSMIQAAERNGDNIWNSIYNKNGNNKAQENPENEKGKNNNISDGKAYVSRGNRPRYNEINKNDNMDNVDENDKASSMEKAPPKNKNIKDSFNNEMDLEDIDNSNEEEEEIIKNKNIMEEEINNNNNGEKEIPTSKYNTPNKNEIKNNNSFYRGSSNDSHIGKIQKNNKDINNNSSTHNKDNEISNRRSKHSVNVPKLNFHESKGENDIQTKNKDGCSPDNENNNNIINIADSTGLKENIMNSNSGNLKEREKDNNNKNKENNKSYKNWGNKYIEPKIDASTPENKKYNSNNDSNIDEDDSDSNSQEKNINDSNDNIIKTDEVPNKKKLSNKIKDKFNNNPNNIENMNQNNNYDIASQEKFSFFNNNNKSNTIEDGTQYINNNKLSNSFPPENYQKFNINSFNSLNGNITTDNINQRGNTNSLHTPQRETFIYKSFNEDKINELYYYIKERKSPHLVICTTKMEKKGKSYYIFISFYTGKSISKTRLLEMDSLLDNRNYINMYEFIIRSGEYYNGFSAKQYNIENLFLKYKQTGEIYYIFKNDEPPNTNSFFNSNSSFSISRGASINNNENSQRSGRHKNNKRKSNGSNTNPETRDNSFNLRNRSKRSISLEESNDSNKSLAKSQNYKEKNNIAQVGGKGDILAVKIKSKKRHNKKKKNNKYNIKNKDQEQKSEEEYSSQSEEETENNSRKRSPIKFKDQKEKSIKLLRGKQRKHNNKELENMMNQLFTPEKRKKREDNNDNKERKAHEKSNSSKYIDISPKYEISTEKENDDNDKNKRVDSENKDTGMENNIKDLAATDANDGDRKKTKIGSGENENLFDGRKKTTISSADNELNNTGKKNKNKDSVTMEKNDVERKKTTVGSGTVNKRENCKTQ